MFRLELIKEGQHHPYEDVKRALELVCHERPINPLEVWLTGLPRWDEHKRVENLLHEYFSARGGEKRLAALSKTWMLGAISRVLEPGSVQPYIPLTLGFMPTEPLIALVGDKWVCTYPKVHPGVARGAWIALAPVKARPDEYVYFARDDYIGHFSKMTRIKRHWTIWGWAPKRPRELGDTRYVEHTICDRPKIANLEADREQLWAEAYHYWQEGMRPIEPINDRNPWQDPWTAVLQDVSEKAWRMGKVPHYTDFIKTLGIKHSHTHFTHISKLMQEIFGVKRAKVVNQDEWFWKAYPQD